MGRAPPAKWGGLRSLRPCQDDGSPQGERPAERRCGRLGGKALVGPSLEVCKERLAAAGHDFVDRIGVGPWRRRRIGRRAFPGIENVARIAIWGIASTRGKPCENQGQKERVLDMVI